MQNNEMRLISRLVGLKGAVLYQPRIQICRRLLLVHRRWGRRCGIRQRTPIGY